MTENEVLEFFLMACEDQLAEHPGDANRDKRVTAAAALVATLYKGTQRDSAMAVLAEETQRPRLVEFVVKDFVRGDKVVG